MDHRTSFSHFVDDGFLVITFVNEENIKNEKQKRKNIIVTTSTKKYGTLLIKACDFFYVCLYVPTYAFLYTMNKLTFNCHT